MAKAKSNKKNGKSLVVVESPAKARTINKYLGDDFQVEASMGHVRDLPKKTMGVDLENGFEPEYEVLPGRKKVISDLKRVAKAAETVYLATDLDREGEAIAWHLKEALNLAEEKVLRVIFNEITQSAIQQAFAHPRQIDHDKVNAQQARRILDRVVGYKISPLLWKKVARGLSAGRVQSVAVKLIVDREREIQAFMPDEYWKLVGIFTADLKTAPKLAEQWRIFAHGHTIAEGEETVESASEDPADASHDKNKGPTVAHKRQWMADRKCFRAELIQIGDDKFKVSTVEDARIAAEAVGLQIETVETTDNSDGSAGPRGIPPKGPAKTIVHVVGKVDPAEMANSFTVSKLTTRDSTSKPPPPFITASLQQAAANTLSFAASRTMRVAQQLYEGIDLEGTGSVGLITYMRTDSTNLSANAVRSVRGYINEQFGKTYLPQKPNVYSSRKSAQEAHEAIRPTDATLTPERLKGDLSAEQFKLYQLVWKRFVACQMTPAQWLVTEASITKATPRGEAVFKATGRQLVFDGFMRVSGVSTRFDEQILPELHNAQPLAPLDLTPTQHFTAPPPRFTEASLVKSLEAEGIGRPSTYASIIQTIQDRNYVDQPDRRFHATDLGIKVTEKLMEGFPDIMELAFTRHMEEELDKIEEAHLDWVSVLNEFYGPFSKDLATAEERMTHAKAEMEPSPYKCKKCDAAAAYRFGKNGRFLSCTRYPDCNYAAPIDREGKPVEPVLIEVECPLCKHPNMLKRLGRFGPFMSCERYPDCKGVLRIDKQGNILPPKPPPVPTDLSCPKCQKGELVIRSGKRGDFLSCNKYPRCRCTLKVENLEEYKKAKSENNWPTPELNAKYRPQAGAEDTGKPAAKTKVAKTKKKKAKKKKKNKRTTTRVSS